VRRQAFAAPRGIRCGAVDLDARPELLGETGVFRPAPDGGDFVAAFLRELNSQMAEPADRLNATRSSGGTPLCRSALNVVMPAQRRGAASDIVPPGERRRSRLHVWAQARSVAVVLAVLPLYGADSACLAMPRIFRLLSGIRAACGGNCLEDDRDRRGGVSALGNPLLSLL
jgi:hypothetical protein